jgi:pyruvate dehydrogenase E2 component (dihydrolipoamide acetyltransferase)
MALRDYPRLNCSYDAAGGAIIFKDYVHIGVAVDTPRGLVVPVVRDVDKRSLPDVAAALQDVAARARDAKFEIAELRGGTFTVTNVGALGGVSSTPMVNFPEVGILGLGKAALQPAVVDGQIVPRRILGLSLSFDHRVVDGADAARFTRDVIDSLENPLRLISFG